MFICNAKYITHAWVQGRTCSLSSGSLRKPEQNLAGNWSGFIWHHLLLQSNRSHRWVYIDDRCVQCNCNFWGHSSSTVVFVFIPVSFWWSRTLQALPRCSWPGTGTWYNFYIQPTILYIQPTWYMAWTTKRRPPLSPTWSGQVVTNHQSSLVSQ